MKKTPLCAAILLLLATLNSQLSPAFAQGAAFTYQGQLLYNVTDSTDTPCLRHK
jgi:hypothetical protein